MEVDSVALVGTVVESLLGRDGASWRVTNGHVLNLFNTLEHRESSVSIEAKSLAGNTLGITTGAASALGVVLCAVVPLLILGAGIAVWLLRRYR